MLKPKALRGNYPIVHLLKHTWAAKWIFPKGQSKGLSFMEL